MAKIPSVRKRGFEEGSKPELMSSPHERAFEHFLQPESMHSPYEAAS